MCKSASYLCLGEWKGIPCEILPALCSVEKIKTLIQATALSKGHPSFEGYHCGTFRRGPHMLRKLLRHCPDLHLGAVFKKRHRCTVLGNEPRSRVSIERGLPSLFWLFRIGHSQPCAGAAPICCNIGSGHFAKK